MMNIHNMYNLHPHHTLHCLLNMKRHNNAVGSSTIGEMKAHRWRFWRLEVFLEHIFALISSTAV